MRKKFEDEELPLEISLTTRRTNKIRNIFCNNMSTNIKLSKAQISKIIQLSGFLRKMLGNAGTKVSFKCNR